MKLKNLLLFVIFFFPLADVFSQSRTNRIYRPCPASTSRAIVDVERDGDVQITPCSGRSFFVGSTAITNVTTTTSVIDDNAVVRGDGGSRGVQGSVVSISDTGGVSHTLTSASTVGLTTTLAAAATANAIEVKASGGENIFNVTSGGFVNVAGTVGSQYQIGGVPVLTHSSGSGYVDLNSNGLSGQTRIGGTSVFLGSGLLTNIDGPSGKLNFDSTVTAGGTTGNATINKPSGTVNFAAGTSSLVLTNSLISANSIILCNVRTNDATALDCRVTGAGAGTATVRTNANTTAETSVGFVVFN